MLYFRSFSRFILVGLVLVFSSQARAAIVGFTDNDTYTTDSFSGLDWLDVTLSTGRSYNDVSAQFGSGGDFEGWRYASTTEVDTFWDNASGTYGPYTGLLGSGTTWVPDLQSLWGVTGSLCNLDHPCSDLLTFALTGTSVALTGPGGLTVRGRWISLIVHRPEEEFDFAMVLNQALQENGAASALGHALVRQSAAPVPAAIWLFGTALIGLVGFGKRRKAA